MVTMNMGQVLLASPVSPWPEGQSRYKSNGWMGHLDTMLAAIMVVQDQQHLKTGLA